MKRILALMLAVLMVAAMAACAPANTDPSTEASTSQPADTTPSSSADSTEPSQNGDEKGEGVMTYAEYAAAELKTKVTVETYVQATQSWWDNKITVYTQDQAGGYFLYEMPCTEDEAKALVPGTKIRVTGYKDAWDGEIEIVDIESFEILPGKYVADPLNVTEILANEEELIKKMNMLVEIGGLVVKSITYKNDEPGDDIYLTFEREDAEYSFCIERYLTGPETDVYKMAQSLKEGDLVAIQGFLYWYNGANTHITSIVKISR